MFETVRLAVSYGKECGKRAGGNLSEAKSTTTANAVADSPPAHDVHAIAVADVNL